MAWIEGTPQELIDFAEKSCEFDDFVKEWLENTDTRDWDLDCTDEMWFAVRRINRAIDKIKEQFGLSFLGDMQWLFGNMI